MKLAIRIFNLVILAISAVATILMFTLPTLSFNSYVAIDLNTFSTFVPQTEFSGDIDIVELVGTDTIRVGIKFQLSPLQVGGAIDGNRNRINEDVIGDNVKEMVGILHEPVDIITDYLIRTNMKKLITDQITTYVDQAREKYAQEYPVSSSTEDIMNEVGMDDEYFTNFSIALYNALDADDATVDSASAVLYDQIDEALAKAEESGVVDTSAFGDENKEAISNSLVGILNSLNLVEDGGKIKKISQIAYVYLADFAKKELTGKVSDPAILEQKTDESTPDYADRLLNEYVLMIMPDVFYQVLGYVCLGLLIALFVFVFIWGLLFLITLIKTFSRKPWTIFGPWFWLLGSLQIIIGVGLIIFGKIILPGLPLEALHLPVTKVVISLRTFAVVPSILYVVCIPVAFVYGFFKRRVKRIVREEDRANYE